MVTRICIMRKKHFHYEGAFYFSPYGQKLTKIRPTNIHYKIGTNYRPMIVQKCTNFYPQKFMVTFVPTIDQK